MKKVLSGIFALYFSVLGYQTFAGEGWSHEFKPSSSFIENRGQFYLTKVEAPDRKVLYAYDGLNTRIMFTKSGVVYDFRTREPKKRDIHEEKFSSAKEYMEEEEKEKKPIIKTDAVGFTWVGSNPNCQIIPEGKTEDYHSYSFYAGGIEKHENFIPGFTKLIYKDLYPGIDVEYVLHPESGIKYTLTVHPGADPSVIKMHYSDRIHLNEQGNVEIGTKFGNIVDHAPKSFLAGNENEVVESSFEKSGKTIGFKIGNYDKSKTLIIDPWVATPSLPNSNKIWETETDNAGNVYIYGGDTFIRVLKYNAAGALQWNYNTAWDSANYWIGGFIVQPVTGDVYMVTGSDARIRKTNTASTVQWTVNPNGVFGPIYEYWSLAFNCDLTKLCVGGSRLQSPLAIPPQIRGTVMDINMSTGAIINFNTVGYGSTLPTPKVQEVSSVAMAPNGKYYFLTLDTIGAIPSNFNGTTPVSFKTGNGYNFNYYIPGYGFGTKQPISAIRANSSAVYTINGATLHKRDLNTGTIIATAPIPGGSTSTIVIGGIVNNNGGLDIDSCGNVYVGSTNAVHKFDGNLNLLSSVATTFAVYDVDVNSNGEVAACGWSGGVGRIQTFNMSACKPLKYECVTCAPVQITMNNIQQITCPGGNNGSATANPTTGTGPYTYSWAPSGGNGQTANNLAPGTYTVTVTDAGACTGTQTVTITAPAAFNVSFSNNTPATCGASNGSVSASATGGTGTLSYLWSNGQSGQNLTNVGAGTYTVTITDANLCQGTATVTITSSGGPAVSQASNNAVSCNGGSNGSASVNITGGTPTYTVNWSNGATGTSASGLSAGPYTVTVTDQNQCVGTVTITITEPPAINVSISGSTQTGCSTQNGTASANASGGTGALTYNWSNGQSGQNATGLGVGIYTVTVTDQNLCAATQTVSITAVNGPGVVIDSVINIKCFGQNTGAGYVSISGGTPTYTVNWSNGATGTSATGLAAGSYTVIIIDAASCSTNTVISITEPSQLSWNLVSIKGENCNSKNGEININPTGGTGPYTYNWSNGQNTQNLDSLSAGTYTCTITDANGCTSVAGGNVPLIPGPAISVNTQQNVSCNGAANGSASVNVSAVTSYTVNWSNGATGTSVTGLGPGSYGATVTDSAGCTQAVTITISEPAQLQNTFSNVNQTSCSSPTGSATANASGGIAPYSYSWSNGQTTAGVTGLAAGAYTVTIADSNNCVITDVVNITAVNGPIANISSQSNNPCNGQSVGTASVSVSGGTPNYTYNWSNGQTGAQVSNLSAGNYSVTITDAAGCTYTLSVTITEPPALVLSVSGNDSICRNDTALLTASGALTYTWMPGNTNGSTLQVIPTANTSYTVTGTDANGCTATSTFSVSLVSPPVINFYVTPNLALVGTPITVVNQTIGATTYYWDMGDPYNLGDISSLPNPPAYTYADSGYYCVFVIAGNNRGCVDSLVRCVEILANPSLTIPNIFSPNNGDDINNFFSIKHYGYKKIQVTIYDRWGLIMAEYDGTVKSWDGKNKKGDYVSEGTYYYVIEATDRFDKDSKYKGHLLLVK